MQVVRNTYPRVPGIKAAEPGDVVQWVVGRGQWLLVRQSDGATVFARDRLPRHQADTRPMTGIIAEYDGWVLEIEPSPVGLKEYNGSLA